MNSSHTATIWTAIETVAKTTIELTQRDPLRKLSEYGIDSLRLVALAAELEALLGIEFSIEALSAANFETTSSVTTMIEKETGRTS